MYKNLKKITRFALCTTVAVAILFPRIKFELLIQKTLKTLQRPQYTKVTKNASIYSENPIPNDDLLLIEEVAKDFNNNKLGIKIIYVFNGDGLGYMYAELHNAIVYNPFDSIVPKQIALNHEFMHGVYEYMRKVDRQLYDELQTLYYQLYEKSDLDFIDESNYTPNLPKEFGHPNSNHKEGFASTGTVTIFYPEKFKQNFKNLPDEQKKFLKVYVLKMFKFFHKHQILEKYKNPLE